MKCPKCGYTSFDFLENCKKCGVDLTGAKDRFTGRGTLFPVFGAPAGRAKPRGAAVAEAPQPAVERRERHEAASPPLSAERAFVPGADTGGDSFDDPHAFSLEALLAESPAAQLREVPESKPPAASFLPEEARTGSAFEADGEGEEVSLPAAGEEAPLPFSAAADFSLAAGEEGLEESFPADPRPDLLTEPLTDGSEAETEDAPADPLRFSAAVDDVPGPDAPSTADSDAPEADRPIRIDFGDFDLEPGPAPLPRLAANEPFPILEGDFAAPAEWGAAAAALEPLPEGESAVEAAAAPPEPQLFIAPLAEPVLDDDPWPYDEPFPDEERPGTPRTVPGTIRLAASAVDLLILGALFALFLLAGEVALQPAGATGGRPLPAILLDQAIPYFLVLFFLGFGYFTLFHFLLGQTVGKIILHLRVETESGEPVTFSRAFLRSTGGLLALLTGGLGFLPALRSGGRGLNDRLAGTRVVMVRDSIG